MKIPRGFFIVLLPLGISSVQAAVPFTYGERTRDFSGWTPAAYGDLNLVTMGGTAVALPTSIAAAEANPAGYALLTSSIVAQVNRTSFRAPDIQKSGKSIDSLQWGLGVSPPPWGFAFAYYSPMMEQGDYISPLTGHTVRTEASIKDFRLTTSRFFFKGTLALGVSADLMKAVREIGDRSYNTMGLSYRLGALVRLPAHVILGASYAPEVRLAPATDTPPEYEMPGFNRAILLPRQISFGVGWMPSRFFRAGMSMTHVAATRNTALLADQSILTGGKSTWVPRLGLSYVLLDYRSFRAEGTVGVYHEQSRISGVANRFHKTLGLEGNIYPFNVAVGFDLAQNFKNVILSVGIDIVRGARLLAIIPSDPVPAYNGILPPMHKINASGLSTGLTEGERKRYEAPSVEDVGEIISNIPRRIKEKFSGAP